MSKLSTIIITQNLNMMDIAVKRREGELSRAEFIKRGTNFSRKTENAIKDLFKDIIKQASINSEDRSVNDYDENGKPIVYLDKLLPKVEDL